MLLGLSIQGIHLWIRKGEIRRHTRTSKRGGYRIPRSELIRLLRLAGREIPGLWTRPRTKVLLIGQDVLIRKLARSAFGYPPGAVRLKTAACPEDGLMLTALFRPDVILLAPSHPAGGMTSEQALAFIRRAKSLKGVRVFAVSVKDGAAWRVRASGADAVSARPSTPRELRDVLLERGLERSGCLR